MAWLRGFWVWFEDKVIGKWECLINRDVLDFYLEMRGGFGRFL
jgi:hypothetical protein